MPSLCCGLTCDDDPSLDKEMTATWTVGQPYVREESHTVVLQPLPQSYELAPKAREILLNKVDTGSRVQGSLAAAYAALPSAPLPKEPERLPTPRLAEERDANGFWHGRLLNPQVLGTIPTVSQLVPSQPPRVHSATVGVSQAVSPLDPEGLQWNERRAAGPSQRQCSNSAKKVRIIVY